METVYKVLDLALAAAAHIPGFWVYVIAAAISGGIGTSIIAAYITYKRKWKEAEKYAKTALGAILTGIGFLMTGAIYVVTNSGDISHILSLKYLADFAPTIAPVWGGILLTANKFYEFGGSELYEKIYNKLGPWLNARNQAKEAAKNKKSVFVTNLPPPALVVKTSDQEDEDVFS